MNWLNKLENKFGRFAIRNLTVYLVFGYLIGYLVYSFNPSLLNMLTLEPAYILQGQIWRIISWILVPPYGNFISILFMALLYYSLGTTLERTWGTFRFNVYIFSGILFTVLGAFLLYFIVGGNLVGFGYFFSTYYINMSIFLAFAVCYPDMKVYLWFIIPIKMKWMAFVYAAFIIYDLLTGNIITRVAIIASLLNFIVFFLSTRNMYQYSPKQQMRKKQFQKQMQQSHRAQQTRQKPHMTYSNGARHRCVVCGRTEVDNPNLEFRYCSKCNGNYEYCQDHLFTHEHVK